MATAGATATAAAGRRDIQRAANSSTGPKRRIIRAKRTIPSASRPGEAATGGAATDLGQVPHHKIARVRRFGPRRRKSEPKMEAGVRSTMAFHSKVLKRHLSEKSRSALSATMSSNSTTTRPQCYRSIACETAEDFQQGPGGRRSGCDVGDAHKSIRFLEREITCDPSALPIPAEVSQAVQKIWDDCTADLKMTPLRNGHMVNLRTMCPRAGAVVWSVCAGDSGVMGGSEHCGN